MKKKLFHCKVELTRTVNPYYSSLDPRDLNKVKVWAVMETMNFFLWFILNRTEQQPGPNCGKKYKNLNQNSDPYGYTTDKTKLKSNVKYRIHFIVILRLPTNGQCKLPWVHYCLLHVDIQECVGDGKRTRPTCTFPCLMLPIRLERTSIY